MLPNILELSEHVTKKIMNYDNLKRTISSKSNKFVNIIVEHYEYSFMCCNHFSCDDVFAGSTDSLPPRSLPNISFGKGVSC